MLYTYRIYSLEERHNHAASAAITTTTTVQYTTLLTTIYNRVNPYFLRWFFRFALLSWWGGNRVSLHTHTELVRLVWQLDDRWRHNIQITKSTNWLGPGWIPLNSNSKFPVHYYSDNESYGWVSCSIILQGISHHLGRVVLNNIFFKFSMIGMSWDWHW